MWKLNDSSNIILWSAQKVISPDRDLLQTIENTPFNFENGKSVCSNNNLFSIKIYIKRTGCYFPLFTQIQSNILFKSINQSIQFLIRVYPHKRGGRIYLTLTAIPLSISLDSRHPPQNQHSCSPSPLESSTSSLVVLASSYPSLQTPTLFSKHAHNPSSTHSRTTSTPFTFTI